MKLLLSYKIENAELFVTFEVKLKQDFCPDVLLALKCVTLSMYI
jgi:hypothetical protein